ncbi:hypothetical protein DICPUDRAFT_150326 [Dictyostelium purpureum]|uniref:Nucleolar protein 56 n=1 Tax=Dictyostelium purpureum TaxID=5786 RepID=F0ZG17_DICPU|nr:uncharacterized protein DICPUDRAFT_150326 [Dictyostelium purpureum]EGC37103.1 hypothetical protein DICPUDRAFT_150326 [Dictyostelium purpureum]|eukprot:XP_003286384.1 hypothetical protein DICPUDRAFT_150326 [Dictyostelium purpureum]
MATHILFETATGFHIFQLSGMESIAEFNGQVQKSMNDFSKFSKICKMIGSLPFTSAENALENINSVSEGILTESLHDFLKQTFSKKTEGVILGVSENKLSASIGDELKISCLANSHTAEIIRCIRNHISQYTKLKDTDLIKAQLGLGHSYSRSKVKFNVHKVDNMVIQSICLLEQLDKDLNTFHMRVREWYSWHFPELLRIVEENIHFAKLAKLIQNKANLTVEQLPEIQEIVDNNESKAKEILNAAKASMGGDISPIDLETVMNFADRVISLDEYRGKLVSYLNKKMNDIAPNLAALVGDRIGAKLISRAGSLTNLAKYPASTVQILGAEKALFRAMKVRGKTPKYGIIYNTSFIMNSQKNKGRIARCLSNKISIASRIDCFSENGSTKFGVALKNQVEDRIKFFNSGVAPKRNLDVMREVIEEVEKDFAEEEVKPVVKESSSKKRKESDSVEEKSSSKKSKKEDKKDKKDEDAMKVDTKEEKSSKKDKKKEEKKEEKKEDKKEKKEEKKEKKEKKEDKKEKKEDKKEKKESSKKDKKK